MTRDKGKGRTAFLVALFLLVSAACGSSDEAGSSGAEAEGAAESVSIRLPWTILGYYTPFYLALEKGWFEEAGVDVEVLEGSGGSNTVKTTALGQDEFGFVDAGTMASLRSQGAAVTMAALVQQKTPQGVVARADSDVESPSDLAGKKVAINPAGGPEAMWPVFLEANDIDPKSVNEISVEGQAKAQAVIQGDADATVGFVYGAEDIWIEEEGVNVVRLGYWDSGVPLLGYGLMVNDAFAESNPEVVEKVVSVVLRAYEYVADDPANVDEAVAAANEHFPEMSPESAKAELVPWLSIVEPTEFTEGEAFGWQSGEAWQQMIEMLVDAELIADPEPPDTYFSNDYLP